MNTPDSNQPLPSPGKLPRKVGNDGTVFKCPICKKFLAGADMPTFPFCSDRCRALDLGNWLDGTYNVSRPIDPTDELDDLPRSRPERPLPGRDDSSTQP